MVSVKQPIRYEGGKTTVVVVDCGCKNSIVRSLFTRGVTVIRVPWDYDFLGERFDGVVISNGPGDPKMCRQTIVSAGKAMEKNYPIFGICLGHQILALAAGADTYKLKFGHRRTTVTISLTILFLKAGSPGSQKPMTALMMAFIIGPYL